MEMTGAADVATPSVAGASQRLNVTEMKVLSNGGCAGIAKKVGQAEWDAVCRAMEQAFKQHQYEVGAVEAIHAVTDILALHFPANESNPNELPDKPAVL